MPTEVSIEDDLQHLGKVPRSPRSKHFRENQKIVLRKRPKIKENIFFSKNYRKNIYAFFGPFRTKIHESRNFPPGDLKSQFPDCEPEKSFYPKI